MAEPAPPTLQMRLDKGALAENWRALHRMSGAAEAGAAVKADAYGLGVDHVVPALCKAGARHFFVAHWSEVPQVLAHVEARYISVLHGPMQAADAAYARAVGVRPVLNTPNQVKLWLEGGGGPCHLMVDTGINRLGIAVDEWADPALGRLDIEILMSHLASADEDSALNAVQLGRFHNAARSIPAKFHSLANSAGIALGNEYAFDLTRPGLSLYGGVPRPQLGNVISQVAYPQAAIIQRRNLSAGDSVGYNAKFTATSNMNVGIVSVGYADGYLRSWAGGGALRSGEAILPLLGQVSMDMVVVDLAAAPHLKEGDWVDIPYDLPQASRISALSQYELLTVLGSRYRR